MEQAVPEDHDRVDSDLVEEHLEQATDVKVSVVLSASQRHRIERLMRFRAGLCEMDASLESETEVSVSQRNHIASLQTLISSFESEIERYAELEAENAQLKKRLDLIANTVEKERRITGEKEDRNRLLITRLQETRNGLQEACGENSRLSLQLSGSQEREETLRQRLRLSENEAFVVQEERDRLRQDYSSAEKSLAEAKSRISSTEIFLNEERLQNQELNRLVEESAVANDLLQKDLEEARDQLFLLKSEKGELVSEIEILNKKHSDIVTAHHKELRKKNSEMNGLLTELDSAKSRIREQAGIIASLEESCRAFEKDLAAQEILAMQSREKFDAEVKTFAAERKKSLQHAKRIASHEEKIAKLSEALSRHKESERLAKEEVKAVKKEQVISRRKIRKLEAVEVRYEKLKARNAAGKPERVAKQKTGKRS